MGREQEAGSESAHVSHSHPALGRPADGQESWAAEGIAIG